LEVPRNHTHDTASVNARIKQPIDTLNHLLRRKSYFLSNLRFGEQPFVMDVPFQSHVSDARMLKKVDWCTWSACPIEIFRRCAYYVSWLNKLADNKALRFWMLAAPLS